MKVGAGLPRQDRARRVVTQVRFRVGVRVPGCALSTSTIASVPDLEYHRFQPHDKVISPISSAVGVMNLLHSEPEHALLDVPQNRCLLIARNVHRITVLLLVT